MATNPKIPPTTQRGPQLHPKLQVEKKKPFPWPLIALIIAAAILVALIFVLPRTPKKMMPPSAATVPQQPTGGQLQLSQIRMTPSPVGNNFYVDAKLFNAGNTQITGAEVQATFRDAGGGVLETQTAKVEGVVGNGQTTTEDLTKAPIKPNESRNIRMAFSHVPQSWNHQAPDLRISAVTATTP
jgi:hypothetical protein